ncbi:hypothetical protein [Staphylococcus massiliensis]|uniref:Uncharacterized protein n=1 Tax=Staphylococcus massiliensis S46 TaxID=1229783 RepID=K9ATD2_9STAP|nr:hypothetical protein [Staphylococcus massiliensis]EKU45852.1 hypothetical protein C273_10692 [Staphylococcus massiliensis S46]MCG3399336.1 hypothetical protein [Staphylococcus massiliensis]PNZ97324.1 hypothetical protein CD133_10920 [Staphylococcus massiliensis CCUG 55927]
MSKRTVRYDEISLFIITTQEYLEFNKLFNELKQQVSFDIVIKVKSMLLRKYLTRSDNVHLGKIIDKLSLIYKDDKYYLQNLKDKYKKIYEGSIIQVDAKGNRYNQIEVLEDIIYGLYLHADSDRIQRLQSSTNNSRINFLDGFISEMETIIIELFNFINSKMDIASIEELPLNKAIVIRDKKYEKYNNLLEDGYWGNLIGERVAMDESNFKNSFDKEDLKLIKLVIDFFQFFQDERDSYKDAKRFVYKPTLNDWGDFIQTKNFILALGEEWGFSDNIQ